MTKESHVYGRPKMENKLSSLPAPNTKCVMMWTVARTLSTALCKCISYIPGVRIMFELYEAANVCGPERHTPLERDSKYEKQFVHYYSEERVLREAPKMSDKETNWFGVDVCTFNWVKEQLHAAAFSDAKMVFIKDMASAAVGHFDDIPAGFQHLIFIRNPYKQITSLKRMNADRLGMNEEDVNLYDIPERIAGRHPTFGYKELMDMYEYLQKNHRDNPVVIIDTDDLQNHTASILRQLLEDVIGIPYNESYLQWRSDDEVFKQWVFAKVFGYKTYIEKSGCHAKAKASACFEPAKEAPSRNSLTDDVILAIDAAMPIYEKLYKLRLKP